VSEIVGAPIDAVHDPAARGDVARNSGATERARDMLGWAPTTTLRDGIAAQVAWELASRS
jgi:nucleoside-diphosphate-sugar epimerase